MKAEYFVYTRTRNVDFSLIFTPSEKLCPSHLRLKFIKEVRGIISEKYETRLKDPVWFFSQKDGIVIFGIGAMNRQLSYECTTDTYGRGVRGFFGIIAKAEDVDMLPFDIEFFKNFYNHKLCPLWEIFPPINKQRGVIVEQNLDSYTTISKGESQIKLNIDVDRTVIHPNTIPIDRLISSAMTYTGDVSVIGVLKTRTQATDSDYKFMNCIVSDCCQPEEFKHAMQSGKSDIWNTNLETNSKESEEDSKEDDRRIKKSLRLRLAVFLIILILVLIILMYLIV